MARRSSWNGSPNSNGLATSSGSPPRPAWSCRWPPKASRRRRANSSSRTFWPMRRVAARRQLQVLAVALEVARPLQLVHEIVERVQVPGGIGTQEIAHLAPVDRAEVARARGPVQLVLERVQGLEPVQLLERRFEPERRVRPRTAPARRGRRAAAGPGSRPAARGPRRGGRRGAGLRGCPGAPRAARASGTAAATASPPSARRAGRSRRPASRAPGKNAPCRARNPSTSAWAGSSPAIRRASSSLRSRTISRWAARSSGLRPFTASASPFDRRSSIEPRRRSVSASNRSRAPGSRKS